MKALFILGLVMFYVAGGIVLYRVNQPIEVTPMTHIYVISKNNFNNLYNMTKEDLNGKVEKVIADNLTEAQVDNF